MSHADRLPAEVHEVTPGCDAATRAVSPVVGVTLLVAIIVVVAPVVAVFATNFDEELHEPQPLGNVDRSDTPSGEGNTDHRPNVEIESAFGHTIDADDVYIKDGDGTKITGKDVWTGGPEVHAGDVVHIDGFASDSVLNPICEQGQTDTVVYQPDDGTSSTLEAWTVAEDPNLPPGSPSDIDGDGIPDWR